jgi:dolichol-phosphate mannosyltransferase
MKCAILIPAYEPQKNLLSIVDELLAYAFPYILIVNDGSGTDYEELFYTLNIKNSVEVIQHHENCGKGAALLTGFKHILKQKADFSGVVTVDADGQHLPKDVEKIGHYLDTRSNALILGSRSFHGEVPFRSKIGNLVTQKVYPLISGQHLSDTQTGLRGIPVTLLPYLIMLTSERYAFEMEMLLTLHLNGIPVEEIPIHTVYESVNMNSHFRPVVDSYWIYQLLFLWFIKNRLHPFASFKRPDHNKRSWIKALIR